MLETSTLQQRNVATVLYTLSVENEEKFSQVVPMFRKKDRYHKLTIMCLQEQVIIASKLLNRKRIFVTVFNL